MDHEEKILEQYFKDTLAKGQKSSECLDEQILLRYFEGNLDIQEARKVEDHLGKCAFCLSQLDLAAGAQKKQFKRSKLKVPPEAIKKAQNLLKENKEKNIAIKKKTSKEKLFLAEALVFFIASFIFPKYFIQCLVATLILGVRWAFESKGGRTLVMVIDSWRRHSHDQDTEISNRLKDHFKSSR